MLKKFAVILLIVFFGSAIGISVSSGIAYAYPHAAAGVFSSVNDMKNALLEMAGFRDADKKNGVYVPVKVVRRDVTQEIQFFGKIVSEEHVDLSFELGGRVSGIRVDVGDEVNAGDLLAQMENSDVRADIRQARANIAAEDALLRELQRGTRKEKIDVQKQKVENARVARDDALEILKTEIQKSYVVAHNAVLDVDEFFTNPRSQEPKFKFFGFKSEASAIETKRVFLESVFDEWDASVTNIVNTKNLNPYVSEAKDNLHDVQDYFNKVAFVMGRRIGTVTVSDFDRIQKARDDIAGVMNAIVSKENQLSGAGSNISLEQKELLLLEAPTTEEEIDRQKARILREEAILARNVANLQKTEIYAPIDGLIAKKHIDVGDIVTPSNTAFVIINPLAYEVEADVSELDIVNVRVGALADVTLDAYGSEEVLRARVVQIDQKETLINNVPTYKVTLAIEGERPQVLFGLTVNAVIKVDKKNVLTLPTDVLNVSKTKTTVFVIQSGELVEKNVVVGTYGDDGYVEIKWGVDEGDMIALFK